MGTFTNYFTKSLSLVIVIVLFQITAYGQFNPIPDICLSNGSIDLFDYTDDDSGNFTMSPGGAGSLSGPSNNIFTPSTAGTANFTYHLGGSNPTQSVQIDDDPVAPTTIASLPDKFCEDQGGNITLSVADGVGTTLNWSTGNFCDEIPVGTGNNLVITAPTTTTTYYANWSNSCGTSLCDNYAVIVYPVSASDMAINGLTSPYCSDAPDDLLNGNPAFAYLTRTFTFTGPAAGFTDNGDGSGTLSPTNIPNGTYSLTYQIDKDNCHHSVTEPVTILPPLVVSFSGLTSPVCIDWGTQLLTGSEAPGGTFSGPGITDNGNGTAIFDPSVAGPGTHTITYTYSDVNNCSSIDSQTVTVNALPSLTFGTLDSDYCIGDALVILTGSEAPNGSFTVNGLSGPFAYFIDNGDGTADFDPTLAGVGTYQIRYHYTDANTCNNTASLTTEVHDILVPIISGDANPCQNTQITYTTDAGMNNYNWVISAGGTITAGGTATDNSVTVNWDSDGAQSVQITYDDSSGGCTSTTVTLNVTVKTEPSATLDPFLAVCLNDAPFTLTGGNGLPPGGTGVYSGPGVAAGIFDPSVAGAGTHTITYTYTAANNCSNSDSESIDVVNFSTVISSLDADYCYLHADETIIGNNTDGGIGSFSISPNPANVAMFTDNGDNTAIFSPINCDPSDYSTIFTITYTYTNGTCSDSDNTSTFVYGQPTVSINGLAGDYCTSDGIDAFTGTPVNGTFSTTAPAGLTDDGAGNGTFDPNAAGAAGSPYTISYYYSDPSGCDNTAVENITITQSPDPVLVSSDANNTICDGFSVTFTATDNESVADTWEFLIDGSNIQGPGASNIFTTTSLNNGEVVSVIASVGASSCSTISSGITTTVVPAPVPTFISGDNSVCVGDAGLIYETEAGMSNYVWAVSGGTITSGGTSTDNTATVTWNTAGNQSIGVNYENANGCSAAFPTVLNVTVTSLPDENLAVSDDNICNGESATITLSSSELGVSYQLRLDSDNSAVGAAINGTGSDINFVVTPTATTVYNIIASNFAGCSEELLDHSTVVVKDIPNSSLTINGSEICEGDVATIVIESSELLVSYQLRLDSDDSHIGVPLIGTGGDLTYNVVPTNSTTYNILATNGNNCSVEMDTKPLVTVNSIPDQSLLVSDDEICLGETASIILYNSVPGVEYQLRLNSDDSNVGSSQSGDGSNLLFNVSPNTTTTYNILATDGNSCSAEVTDLAVVQVNPLPDNTLSINNPSICLGEMAVITLESSVPGVTYQLRLDSDNSNVGAAVPGNGSDITFSVSPTSTTVYNVLATSSDGCSNELINKTTVTVFDAPADNLIVDDDEICFGETASIVLYNSEIGVTYQLRLDSDNSNVGSAVTGTGGNIVFNVATVSTTIYNVYAYNSNACALELLDKSTVTVNPLPNNTLTVGDDAICEGEIADIVLYNSVLGVNYQLRLDSDNSNIGSSQAGNGGSLTFHDSPASTTTYNILAIDNNGCSNEIIDKAIIQVYPLANDNLTVSDPTICIGENAVISVNNSETGVSYQLRLDSDNSNVGAAVPGNNGTITFDVSPLTTTLFNVLATTSNGCDVELLDRSLVTVNSTPDETLAVSSPTICNGETAEIVVYTSEVGVSYQLRLDSDNTTVGVPIAGNGGDISFFINPISSTTYNVLATGGNTCSVELINKSDVTVYPLPDPTILSDNATICVGETASILLNNTEIGVNYQLRLDSDNSNIGAAQLGNGGILVFDVTPIVSTVYNFYATTSNACSQELYDKPIVTVLQAPDLNLSLSDEEICYGETATIVLSNSELGVSYQLRLNVDNSLVGGPVSGTGFDIEFDVNPLSSQVYNVLATNSNTCSGTLTDLSSVTVYNLPAKPIITAAGPTTFCEGGSVDLSSSSADNYLWNTGETTQTITVNNGGIYSLTVTDANSCTSPESDPIIVDVLPLPTVDILGLDSEFCHDAPAVTITGDPIPGGTTSGSFSGPGITDNGDGTAIFDPIAAGIGGPYNIEYTYTNVNSCTNSIIRTTIVNEAPNISFSGLNSEYCVDNTGVILTGSEAPYGTFSGLGITDNGDGTAIFNPSAAGIGGPYTISYNYTNSFGCSNTYTEQTVINPLPIVTFGTLNSEYCVDHAVITLTGNQAPDGFFTGVGVFDNGDGTATFDPSAAGVGGPYAITYTYSDGNTCTNSSTQHTTIHDVPTVNFSGLGTDYCVDASSVTLVGNHMPDGFFTGPGITDNGDGTAEFIPSLAGVGANQAITYTYTDPNFCINSQTKTVNIHALPVVSILNLESNYCVNDPDILIIGNPLPTINSNGYFTGDGITDNGDGTANFSPSSLLEGNIYTITYSFVDSNTCMNTVFEDVNIIDLPNAPTANDIISCYGDAVPNLVATGLPGYQIIWYNSLGDSIYSGNSYPTGLTDVGVYEFYVSQIHPVTECESQTKLVTLSIVDLPIVSLDSFSDVCIYDLIIYLTTGSPAGGEYSGNSGILELPGGDYIFHPELAGAGTHDIIYTFEDPITGCQDTAMKTITVHDRPIVSLVDLDDVYCVNGVDVTIHGNYPGYGSFSGAGITDNGDGSAIFSPSIADLGTHQIVYEYQDINTSCTNQDTAVTIVEGAPESVNLIQISDPEICADAGGTVTLEAIGGDGTWVNWFENTCEGDEPDILSANGDSTLIVIPAPTLSTYYFAQWETECGVSEFCAEDYIVVTQIPTTPDTAWVTPDIICNNDQDSVVLYITGGNFGNILEWTSDSCDGAIVGQTNGDPLLIASPDTTTRYFARWINECGESECTESIRVLVTQPAEEVIVADADSNFFCVNTLNKVELRAFGGRGDTIIWYYDSLGYNPVPMDSILSISQPLGDTIEIIPPTLHTSYFPFRATPCEQIGGNISVDLFVFGNPVAVDSAYAFPETICFGHSDSITLIAEGGNGETLEWYSGSCENGVFLGNGNNFKIYPPDVSTTYFARWTTPCGVSECYETSLNIYPPTIDPDLIASDTNDICSGNLDDIQLVLVGGSGDSVVWFSDSCGGTQLDGSTFYYQSVKADTIVIPAPTSDTTFYAYWATSCEVSECVSIDINVYPQPEMIDTLFTNYNNFCSGSVANITLTALGGSGDVISWTRNSCDGPVVAVTNQQSITIPAPMDTTTYYAKWKTFCDSTECLSVQINVPPSPQDPDQIQIMESLICDNTVDSITMILQGGSGYEVVWFYGPYCGNDTIPNDSMNKLSISGDSIRIARPSQSMIITANWASFEGICGSSECVSTEVFVYEAPLAYFEVSGGVACENTLLQFAPDSDPGSGLITNLHWDFGDGTTIDTNLQVYQYHTYESMGLYDVQLQVTNTYGCEDTLIIPLEISEAPEALFSYSSSCLGEPVQFIDESVSAVDSIAYWFWDFGDGSSINDTSSMQNPTYSYQQAGIYEVTLVITDTSGCSDQIIQEVNIAPQPTAYFQLGTASCQSVPVFFNDSSYTEFNAIGTWIWNFGDGSQDSVITAPANPDIWYTYFTNGDFTVSLTVIDTSGCYSETFYQYFEVRPQPIAGFTFSDTACQTGIINFFDTSYHEPGTIGEAWSWNFGDGGFAYQQNPVHSYIETGQTYNVQMIITDEFGCQDTVAHEVDVNPELEISFNSNIVCEGESTEFVANIIQPEEGTVAEWQWYFGDNSDTIVNQDTVYHSYASGGTFYATLVGVDDGGCETIVINQPVLVNPAPIVDFFIPEASCNDPSIFYDHSVANSEMITNYHFDYGDGTYESFTNETYIDPVEHNYPAGANEYIATISLINSNGCESVQEFVVQRESCITMAFDIQYPACINQELMFVNNSFINNEQVIIDSIIWNFGDGVIYELPIEQGDTVYHTYQSSGLVQVKMTLVANNQFGDFTTNSIRSIYINETPNTEFTIDQSLLCSRDSIQFTDHSWVFNGEIVGWYWDFGDDMIDSDTSIMQNPQFWYTYSGDYTPELIAVSDSGCMNSFGKDISLEASPINHLFANVEFGCGPQNEILFRDTAYLESGSIDYYQWIFGFNDTVYSDVDSLWHQLNIGEYNVISRVVSDNGCSGIDSLSGFNVFDQPLARFGYFPDDPSIREPEVYFNDQSIGALEQILYYHWDFGDNTDTVGLDPVHIYQDTGLFNVILTIQDANGCVDTVSHSVYVDPVFSFYMPNAFSPNDNGLNDEFGPIGSYFDDTFYEFQIYSRWGELLFETKDPYEYWKGDYNLTSRNPVPLGVYSWIIRVEDALGEEHVYKGQVTVVR